eukprot:450935-Amphidinium_carterae.1
MQVYHWTISAPQDRQETNEAKRQQAAESNYESFGLGVSLLSFSSRPLQRQLHRQNNIDKEHKTTG